MSRDKMKKVYIDEINSQAEKGNFAPSPDRYNLRGSFESITPFTPKIGVRRNILEMSIGKTLQPGPGTYSPEKTHSSQYASYISSKFGKEIK